MVININLTSSRLVSPYSKFVYGRKYKFISVLSKTTQIKAWIPTHNKKHTGIQTILHKTAAISRLEYHSPLDHYSDYK